MIFVFYVSCASAPSSTDATLERSAGRPGLKTRSWTSTYISVAQTPGWHASALTREPRARSLSAAMGFNYAYEGFPTC